MRTLLAIVCTFMIFSLGLEAQDNMPVVIRAGTKILDYFPVSERYLYPSFVPGQVVFRTGKANKLNINYNILFGEIEFIQSKDTLAISAPMKKEIRYVIAVDTFYYDNGFIEVISGGELRVGLKQAVRIKDVLKKGAFGTTARNASVDTYNSMAADGISYNLVPEEDIEVQKQVGYYFSYQYGTFVSCNKKNVLDLFPQKSDQIKAYLKSNKVDFSSRDDILRFAGYLRSL